MQKYFTLAMPKRSTATEPEEDNKAQQLTLADALQRCKKFPMESLRALAITQKVWEFIVWDAQPVSVVEDEGFHRPLEYIQPRYSLPSRKYFSKTGIQFISNSTTVSDMYQVSKPSHQYRCLKKSDWCIPTFSLKVTNSYCIRNRCQTNNYISHNAA